MNPFNKKNETGWAKEGIGETASIENAQDGAAALEARPFWAFLSRRRPYERYLEREDRLRLLAGKLFLAGTVGFGSLYLLWFFSVLNWHVWYVSIPFFIAEVGGLITAVYFATIIWYPRHHRPEGITWNKTPSVDVFITTCGEPIEILKRTVSAATEIDYPSKNIFILDDAASPRVKILAVQKDCQYIERSDRSNAKAGNLNHALSQTKGEFVLALDADQVPERDIIKRLINYFKLPYVGFVQSAQRFVLPDEDPFGNSDDVFYRIMQPGKDNDNAAFSCGSGVIYRRSALESINGFSTWNLVEDVHTSMRLHEKGWRSVYHNHPLTTGTAPADIYSVYKQRQQWATDSLRLFFWDNPFKHAGLTLKQQLQYFHIGFVYLASAFMMPLYFVLPSWSLLTGHFLANAPVLDYFFYRGLYCLFMLLALVALEHPADSRKPYKMWAGFFPVFMKATFAALRSRREKPRYSVTKKTPEDPNLVQRLKAIIPQGSIILLTIGSAAYGLFYQTLSLELLSINLLWGAWVVWSLSAICSAAIKRPRFSEESLVPQHGRQTQHDAPIAAGNVTPLRREPRRERATG